MEVYVLQVSVNSHLEIVGLFEVHEDAVNEGLKRKKTFMVKSYKIKEAKRSKK